MANETYTKFRFIVAELINRWTALKLAVEHGMHKDNDGSTAAVQIIDDITNYCLNQKNVGSDNVKEELDDIMDKEFDTICEDGSTKEIAELLIYYLHRLNEDNELLLVELNKLPDCEKWIGFEKKKIYNIKESSSESEDDDMDVDVAPSTSGKWQVEEGNTEKEHGWTTVRSRRK